VLETLLDEGKQRCVLFVPAVEERADVTGAFEDGPAEVDGLLLWHRLSLRTLGAEVDRISEEDCGERLPARYFSACAPRRPAAVVAVAQGVPLAS
jgi:hypothetical protein